MILKLLLSSVWVFLKPFISIFLTDIGARLASLAWDAVRQIDNTETSSAVKRDLAYNMITKQLAHDGIAIGEKVTKSMINAAIEAAVQKLNVK